MTAGASGTRFDSTLRLFVVLLGGAHPRAHVELHDVVFAVADSLANTHAQLRQQWFGDAKGLHIDAWMEVDGVDGWQVRLHPEPPPADAPRLYFANLGGYLDGLFGEDHRYVLVVADTLADAKRKALAAAGHTWHSPHRDALFEVDACLPLGPIGGLHVHLLPGPHAGITTGSDYIPLS
ncbi:MAG: DUF1543 domain-containing protein [Thermomonas hydrothermalis]|uniref:DUF1543 domain-containing protein n=1 Tax=Thermomonas hydrothermalis TaxID=213588 RepID=UPI00235602C8|nr:DUF1543 domain-containing protein [Thermomonas hydrothermalis]MCL6619086.1 DUF1543 domain-containing protein [Thermomonas hydrothermalis]